MLSRTAREREDAKARRGREETGGRVAQRDNLCLGVPLRSSNAAWYHSVDVPPPAVCGKSAPYGLKGVPRNNGAGAPPRLRTTHAPPPVHALFGSVAAAVCGCGGAVGAELLGGLWIVLRDPAAAGVADVGVRRSGR